MRPLDADQHGGLSVTRVALADGSSAVLRPWPTDGYRALAEASNLLANTFRVPRHQEFSACGRQWMAIEWIDARTALTQADLRACYFGYGALAATAWLLGITDLHAENVVVSMVPYVIDAEFVLDPLSIRAPLSITSLIRPPTAAESVQSTIDGPDRLRRRGTRLVDASGRVSRSKGQAVTEHRPLNEWGHPVSPEKFADDLIDGLNWAWGRLVAIGPKFFLQATRKGRHILRPTRLYQAYLDLLDAPSVTPRDQRALNYVDDLMQRGGQAEWSNRAVAKQEAEALARGDVPWFGWWGNGSASGFVQARDRTDVVLEELPQVDRASLLEARFTSNARDRLAEELRVAVSRPL
ncbi:DUF4135 domain-containing protein [Streptomyces sp. Y7]|uniref:DUF4135 domain-containing protein n=1 Tax=Streptomyces sp. Y7 TaxID=3342392 RepID=UPI0037227B03